MSHRLRAEPENPTGSASATAFREALYQTVRNELEECAKLADEMAGRLTRSGKNDQAMVAVQLAAQIRARLPDQADGRKID